MRSSHLLPLFSTCILVVAASPLSGCGGNAVSSAPPMPASRSDVPLSQTPQTSETSRLTNSSTTHSLLGPEHILTMAKDESVGEGSFASAADVVRLVSYARGDSKAVSDCHSVANGCKAVFYFDYSHPYAPGSGCDFMPDKVYLSAATEKWFVHWRGYTNSTHRVHGKGIGGQCTVWQMNPSSPGVESWWLRYLRDNANNYDDYYVDDDAPNLVDATYFPSGGGCAPWPSYCYTTEELADNADLAKGRADFVNAMNHEDGSPMYFFSNGGILPYLPYTNRFLGESCEGCIANDRYPVVPNNYVHELNEMATLNAAQRDTVLISKGHWVVGSAEQNIQRLVTTAIAWLGQSEGHTVVMENVEDTTRNLAVWPEEMIYPSSPLESMSGDASGLAVTSGVYRREFARCYLKGIFFGQCAAILNANGFPVTVKSAWLRQSYHHEITLQGGDVLSGGLVKLLGAFFSPGSTRVEAGGAILLAP
jgi:hypothetical protein